MGEETKDALRPHKYDGIQEYDNQLPKWWLYKFYLCILFAAGYFYWYQLSGSGHNLVATYEAEHAAQAQQMGNAPKKQLSEEELLAIAAKPEMIKKGAEQFKTKCLSCHLDDGGGLVGPNLTDDYWIHGPKMTDMVKVITEGVPAKGMPTWGAVMNEEEIQSAAAFVRTLHGTKPKTPKAPEGTLFK